MYNSRLLFPPGMNMYNTGTLVGTYKHTEGLSIHNTEHTAPVTV